LRPQAEANGLIEKVYPAFEQQVRDFPRAERQQQVHYHNQANDLRRGVKLAE
jgi:hypothetical protein